MHRPDVPVKARFSGGIDTVFNRLAPDKSDVTRFQEPLEVVPANAGSGVFHP
jgi:hypothetical protein